MEISLLSKNELELSLNRKLVTSTEASKLLKMTNATLNKLLQQSLVPNDIYFVAGIDFRTETRNKFLFCKDSLHFINDRFLSLEQIAKQMGHKRESLDRVIKNVNEEVLKKIRPCHNRWDKNWFLEKAELFIDEEHEGETLVTELYLRLLGEEVEQSLERYLRHRTTEGSIEISGQVYFRKLITKDSRLKLIKQELIRYLHKIHRGRLGLPLGLQSRRGKHLFTLSEKDQEQLSRNPLDLFSLDSNDYVYLCGSLNEFSQFQVRQNLRPFLYFLLYEKWRDYRKALKLHLTSGTEFDSNKELQLLELQKIQYDELLKLHPRKYPEDVVLRKKVFGTREQVVRCIVTIRQNNFPKDMHAPTKNAAMIGMGFFTAARPIELWAMEIDKHLVIETDPENPNFGLLKKFIIQVRNQKVHYKETVLDDNDGWGLMKITKNIAKGRYKGSPYKGTFITPRVVDLINEYLTWLYHQNPEARGKGFLFRPNPLEPNIQYCNPNGMTSWVNKWKKYFDFLSVDQQRYFRFYNSRHTCNNLIVNRTVYRQQFVNDARIQIGVTHLRHDSRNDMAAGGFYHSSNRHYQEATTEATYFLGVKAALNFPFDLEELQIWEKENNPFFDDDSLMDIGLFTGDDFDDDDFDDQESYPESINISNSPTKLVCELAEENKEVVAQLKAERDDIQSKLNVIGNPHQALKIYGLKKADRLKTLQETNQKLIQINNKITRLGG